MMNAGLYCRTFHGLAEPQPLCIFRGKKKVKTRKGKGQIGNRLLMRGKPYWRSLDSLPMHLSATLSWYRNWKDVFLFRVLNFPRTSTVTATSQSPFLMLIILSGIWIRGVLHSFALQDLQWTSSDDVETPNK